MSHPYLYIGRVHRRTCYGTNEDIRFLPGVNLLVGRPNTGKTKWLQTVDYLLGDTGENPFQAADEQGLAEKYESAGAELGIGEELHWIERRWREQGEKTKIFIDGNSKGTSAKEFQQWLIQKLCIPPVNFPKGNPMSGQTWPELSFRMLLRHIYRQQRFWSDIADLQPDGEQHACLLQFLGLAQHVFSDDYGKLVTLKTQIERLKARRDQYHETLNEIAQEIVSDPGLCVAVTPNTVQEADNRLDREIKTLLERRTNLITNASHDAIKPENIDSINSLGEERAKAVVDLERLQAKEKANSERLRLVQQYYSELQEEINRLARAEDAGVILADLKITHCPACDQPIVNTSPNKQECFLCHQAITQQITSEQLGSVRIRFELDRLSGELKEADELLSALKQDSKRISEEIRNTEERIRMVDNQLAPSRQAVAALIQENVSAIDMELGNLSEKQRHVGRISSALGREKDLTDRIIAIEREIEPLQVKVDEALRATDFGAVSTKLEDGINEYLAKLNVSRPGVWRHSNVNIDLSRNDFSIRIGRKRWSGALGGTDRLYFLMAYHYGLLSLSDKSEKYYPGISIIDLPGEFAGEAVEDKENFIVQPFIDLLEREEFQGAQLIMTGVSFTGLSKAHRIPLTEVFIA